MDQKTYDVAVVGGGPAGTMAAIGLAKRGIDVCILDKAVHPRYKVCGGGLLHRAAEQLPISPEPFTEVACRNVELNFGGRQEGFVVRRDFPVVRMVMRADLDAALWEEAGRCGAHCLSGPKVCDLETSSDSVLLKTDRGEVRARFVVGADGVNSVVARRGGWSPSPLAIAALECELAVDDGTYGRFCDAARFDIDHPRRGYSWVFPKKNHLSVGLCSMVRPVSGKGLRADFHAYLKNQGIVPKEPGEIHAALIPVFPRPGQLADKGILLTGDAAGLADPLTAEGLTAALESGRLAAVAIAEGEMKREKVQAIYRQKLAEGLLADIEVSRKLAVLLYHHPHLRNLIFRFYGQAFVEKMTDIMTGKRNFRSVNLSPSSFLKLAKFWR